MQRSAAIRKIEQDLIELSHLYNEVAELVHQQEPAVQQIQQGAEETHRNVEQANTKLDSAIQSAKNARRWKWYALIIIREYLPVIPRSSRPANLLFSHYYRYRRRCGCRCHHQQQEQVAGNSDLPAALHHFPTFSMYDLSRDLLRIFPFVFVLSLYHPFAFSSCVKAMSFDPLSLCVFAS